MRAPSSVAWVGVLLAGLAASCDRVPAPPPPASAPAAASAPAVDPQIVARLEQAAGWSREEALTRLEDDSDAAYAAVRLVELAEVHALAIPRPMLPDAIARIRVRRLNDTFRAVGLGASAASGDAALRAALLIRSDGEVVAPGSGVEEEVSVLHVSADPDVFPHVIVRPDGVLVVRDWCVDAIVSRELKGACFRLRWRGEFPYLAIEHPAARGVSPARGDADEDEPDDDPEARARGELARYTWDPFEEMFMGPADGALPESVGGRFSLDLTRSEMLVPVGGQIEAPVENTPPPASQPDGPDEPQ